MNLQKLVDICRYELPTNLQNFRQKDSTEVKIFHNVSWGLLFETPCINLCILDACCSRYNAAIIVICPKLHLYAAAPLLFVVVPISYGR